MSTSASPGRHLLVIVSGFEALATAIWLVPASIYVVKWPASGPQRIAELSTIGSGVALLGAAAVLAAIAIGWAWAAKRLARFASVAAPLGLFWVWAVPYLPWLPDRVPMLLVLAGPLRWFVAAVAVGAALKRAAAGPIGRLEDILERPSRVVVFVVSLVLYAGFGWLNAGALGPGGDEPHYLMIAQSLLADGDIKIENNHQRREYEAFFSGELRPDYMKRGLNGEIYSIHAPGLPILLLPSYAIGGYRGTVLFMCLIAALTALAIFDLARSLAGPQAALITWAASCLTVPFVPHSWLLFPEIPGALVVAWAALWLWKPVDDRVSVWLARGLALATLPWLHTKFVIFLALFGAALLWKLRARVKLAAAFVLPIAISLAGWLAFFYIIYGTVNPEAPYGDYTDIYVLAKNIPRGLLGFVFDQKFGLLLYVPIYAFAIVGYWQALRRPDLRLLVAVLFVVTAVHVGSTTRLYMWWGGTSAPARFLVPIVPCLAPMLALAAATIRGRVARVLLGLALAVSVTIALVGAARPDRLLLFSDPRGYARLVETIQSGAPITFSLPTFTNEDWLGPIAGLLPWIAAAVIAAGAMAAAARTSRLGGLWLGTLGCVTFLLSAGVVAARPTSEARSALARTGAMDLLWRYDGTGFFDYGSLRRVDEARVRALDVVTFEKYPVEQFALPQGAYEARVWFSGSLQREGDVVVSSRGRMVMGRTSGPFSSPAIVRFELPVAVGRLSVDVPDPALAANVTRVEIAPSVLVPLEAREPRATRAFEPVANRPGAFVIYLDDHEYPEGSAFWTRATEAATVVIAPGGYSQINLTLHLGPRDGNVTVEGAGVSQTVRVEPNQTAEVQLTVPHGARLVPVTIQAPTMFRPSEVDRASSDKRLLGCQVRVDVQ